MDNSLMTATEQDNTHNLSQIEQNFKKLWERADQYQNRISNIQNIMQGGASYNDKKRDYKKAKKEVDPSKPKREANPTLLYMQDIAKTLRTKYGDTASFEGMKWTDYIGLASKLIEDAKQKSGDTDLTARVKELVMGSTNDVSRHLETFKREKETKTRAKEIAKAEKMSNARVKIVKKYKLGGGASLY